MQRRREKKKAALAPVPNVEGAEVKAPDGGTAGPPTTIDDICSRITTNYEAKYSMERFLDCNSRDEVFQELFKEVNEISSAMAPLKKFYDTEGYFQVKQFQEQTEVQLSPAQYTDCIKVVSPPFLALHDSHN